MSPARSSTSSHDHQNSEDEEVTSFLHFVKHLHRTSEETMSFGELRRELESVARKEEGGEYEGESGYAMTEHGTELEREHEEGEEEEEEEEEEDEKLERIHRKMNSDDDDDDDGGLHRHHEEDSQRHSPRKIVYDHQLSYQRSPQISDTRSHRTDLEQHQPSSPRYQIEHAQNYQTRSPEYDIIDRSRDYGHRNGYDDRPDTGDTGYDEDDDEGTGQYRSMHGHRDLLLQQLEDGYEEDLDDDDDLQQQSIHREVANLSQPHDIKSSDEYFQGKQRHQNDLESEQSRTGRNDEHASRSKSKERSPQNRRLSDQTKDESNYENPKTDKFRAGPSSSVRMPSRLPKMMSKSSPDRREPSETRSLNQLTGRNPRGRTATDDRNLDTLAKNIGISRSDSILSLPETKHFEVDTAGDVGSDLEHARKTIRKLRQERDGALESLQAMTGERNQIEDQFEQKLSMYEEKFDACQSLNATLQDQVTTLHKTLALKEAALRDYLSEQEVASVRTKPEEQAEMSMAFGVLESQLEERDKQIRSLRKANHSLEKKLVESAPKHVHEKLINHIKDLKAQLDYYRDQQLDSSTVFGDDTQPYTNKREATSAKIAQDKSNHARQARESAVLQEAQSILGVAPGQFISSLKRMKKVFPQFVGCKKFVEEMRDLIWSPPAFARSKKSHGSGKTLKDTAKRLELFLKEHENNRAKLRLISERLNKQLQLPPDTSLDESLTRILERVSMESAMEMLAAAFDIDNNDQIRLQEATEQLLRYREEVSSAVRKLKQIWKPIEAENGEELNDAELILKLCAVFE